MGIKQIKIKLVLSLDERWNKLTEDELLNFVRKRIDTSLGFRAKVKRLSMIDKKDVTQQHE